MLIVSNITSKFYRYVDPDPLTTDRASAAFTDNSWDILESVFGIVFFGEKENLEMIFSDVTLVSGPCYLFEAVD